MFLLYSGVKMNVSGLVNNLRKKLLSDESFSGMIVDIDNGDPRVLFLHLRVEEDESTLGIDMERDKYVYLQRNKDAIPNVDLGSTVRVTLQRRIMGYPIPYSLDDQGEILYYPILKLEVARN